MKFVWIAVVVLLLLLVAAAFFATISMPRRSWRGPLPPRSVEQARISEELRRDVVALTAFGPRNVPRVRSLQAAADFIQHSFEAAGYQVTRQTYVVEGVRCDNVEAELRGADDRALVVGAHYDSIGDAPGADDNASGVAGMLAIARRLAHTKPRHTVRFVAFVNEEPPYFQTMNMGSAVWTRRAHERGDRIVGMLSLESIGYYSAEPHSQQYPPPLSAFYPSTGDFIAFAGDTGSRALVRTCVRSFREHAQFPSEGAALPRAIPQIGWSDQWAFWRFGWPALMVTDTAPFRNPHYHMPTDRPETLDYDRMGRVVEGLVSVVNDLARAGRP